jgi:hypothetical protein
VPIEFTSVVVCRRASTYSDCHCPDWKAAPRTCGPTVPAPVSPNTFGRLPSLHCAEQAKKFVCVVSVSALSYQSPIAAVPVTSPPGRKNIPVAAVVMST